MKIPENGVGRTISNPIIKDEVTFVSTSKETGGEYTQVRMMLAPKGGNSLHYHRTYSEEFRVISGTLGVRLGKQQVQLSAGESAVADIGVLHRFFNTTDAAVEFDTILRPGHASFENGLRIAYGLARDGLTNRTGVPKNLMHLALIADLTDTRLPGVLGLFNPLFKGLADTARRKGIESQFRKYLDDETEASGPTT